MLSYRVGFVAAFVTLSHVSLGARLPANASKVVTSGKAANGTSQVPHTLIGAKSVGNGTGRISRSNASINATVKASALHADIGKAKETKNVSTASHALSASPLAGVVPHFLSKLSADGTCACHFEDQCSCTSTMEFMDCIATACSSGKCDCHDYQFHHACLSISSTCPDLELECSVGQAQCLYERESRYPAPQVEQKNKRSAADVYDLLRDLKERKCRLQLQVEDGWLNSEKHLEEVNSEIDKLMDELAAMKEKKPEMHCEKHFEEWHYPESAVHAARKEVKETPAAPELELPKATKVNKIILALINGCALGVFGIDRCYTGQVMLGVLKCITLGGFGIWASIDFIVILINCLAGWTSMGAVWFNVNYEQEHVEGAFWIALVLLVLTIIISFAKGADGVAAVRKRAKGTEA